MPLRDITTVRLMSKYIARSDCKSQEDIRVAILEFLYVNSMKIERYRISEEHNDDPPIEAHPPSSDKATG